MEARNLARELSLLATEVDSLEKARVLAQGERDRELKRRAKAEAEAEDLRAELQQARRRAKAAERTLAELSSSVDVSTHQAESNERERRALEVHLKEVLANLRQAAQDAQHARRSQAPDEVTLVTTLPPDSGW